EYEVSLIDFIVVYLMLLPTSLPMDFRRPYEIFAKQAVLSEKLSAFRSNNSFKKNSYSFGETKAYIDQISAGLLELGAKKHTAIGICSHVNSAEWVFIDAAIQQIGAIVIPLSQYLSSDQLQAIISDAEMAYCFISNRELFEKFEAVQKSCPKFNALFCIDELPDLPCLAQLMILPQDRHLEQLQSIKASIHEEDTNSLYYFFEEKNKLQKTKLNHKSFKHQILALKNILAINSTKKAFSYRSLDLFTERLLVYTYSASGAETIYANIHLPLIDQIKLIKPHYFGASSLFLKDIYKQAIFKLDSNSNILRVLNKWGLRLTKKFPSTFNISFIFWLQLQFANLFVFKKLKNITGGRTQAIISNYPNPPLILTKFFYTLNIPIYTSFFTQRQPICISMNQPTQGQAHLLSDGYLMPYVTSRQQVETIHPLKLTINFSTKSSDSSKVETNMVGFFLADNFLKLTGNQKLFYSAGTIIYPNEIEILSQQSLFIRQSILTIDQQKKLTLLIAPDEETLKWWAKNKGIIWTNLAYMLKKQEVLALFREEISIINEHITDEITIEKYLLCNINWPEKNYEPLFTQLSFRSEILSLYNSQTSKAFQTHETD
ncbi:MAG: AMP-binding protein, partial [Bacteroidota bacterium]